VSFLHRALRKSLSTIGFYFAKQLFSNGSDPLVSELLGGQGLLAARPRKLAKATEPIPGSQKEAQRKQTKHSAVAHLRCSKWFDRSKYAVSERM